MLHHRLCILVQLMQAVTQSPSGASFAFFYVLSTISNLGLYCAQLGL
jgi:hypothetical protein